MRRNTGYTERDNGTKISLRAYYAEEDGKFSKGHFINYYKVSKKHFEILVLIGIIKTNEWHHTGANFTKRDFFEWDDSEYIVKYENNRKNIDKLSKEFYSLQWEYKPKLNVISLDDYIYSVISSNIRLTAEEEAQKTLEHTTISNLKDIYVASERRLKHIEIDEKYNQILKVRFNEQKELNLNELTNKYYEEWGDNINKNKEIELHNATMRGKEKVMEEIAKLLDYELSKVHITSISIKEQVKIDAEKRKLEEIATLPILTKQLQNLEKKRNQWRKKYNDKVIYFERITEKRLPQFYIVTCEEMQGKYGWFSANSMYNLTTYYSGLEFSNKQLLNSYKKIYNEIEKINEDISRIKKYIKK